MAFESVVIRSTRNAATPIDGPRDDLAAGETIVCSLVGLAQTPVSYEWTCFGRPEGSVVGGGGANPWLLSTGASCSFTVDADGTNVSVQGPYMIECVVNKGSLLETRFSVALWRNTGILIPGLSANRALRFLGMFESLEDRLAAPAMIPGWAYQANRWFEWMRLKETKAADIASATSLALPAGVGSARVTGTTTIDYIQKLGRQAGSEVVLHLASSLSFRHNQGSPPTNMAALNTTSAATLTPTANSLVALWFDGTVWHVNTRKAG